uniref:non-ribosomal peptide synthetase n=1 Tax=Paenibacillus massiliensis TaxID=225917 RepID=UPI000471C6C5
MSNEVMRGLTAGDIAEPGIAYWSSIVANSPEFAGVPFDYHNKGAAQYEVSHLDLTPADISRLRSVCEQEHISLAALLASQVYYLIHRYGQSEQLLLGCTLREKREKQQTEDCCIVQLQHDDQWSLVDFLRFVEQILQSSERQSLLHFEAGLRSLAARGKSIEPMRAPLLDAMLELHLDTIEEQAHDRSNKALPVLADLYSFFDLGFCWRTCGAGLACEIHYNITRYKTSTVEQLTDHLRYLLQHVHDSLHLPLNEVPLFSLATEHMLLNEFNSTYCDYPADRTLQELFVQQARTSPDQPAVMDEHKQLSYQELDVLSNRCARWLKEEGIRAGDVVAVMMPRSVDTVIVVLAILKTGAVCLPVDRFYPSERVLYMLEDSGARMLIHAARDEAVMRQLPKLHTQTAAYEVLGISAYSDAMLPFTTEQASPAYMIYTSGSEGAPKGVQLSHHGIINHVLTKVSLLDMNEQDRISHNINLSFVASIWIIHAPLLTGAELVIYSDQIIKDGPAFFRQVDHDGITLMEIVPSALEAYLDMVDMGAAKARLSHLKKLLITGERVHPELVNRFYREYRIELINAYGQSECSDDTLHYTIPYSTHTDRVPVGKPSHNTRVYILSDRLQLQPPGVRGELYIAGEGVCDGYHRRPELTAARFVANPFVPGSIMFRTGDYARWDENGNVEYLGRVDQQVKIRGYRIELDEIKTCLLHHPDVKQTIVTVRKNAAAAPMLCAYIVCHQTLSTDTLRDYLEERLPEYMLPDRMMVLEAFPLLPNGKINMKALPDPPRQLDYKSGKYEHSKNTGDTCSDNNDLQSTHLTNTEQRLAHIWCRLLDLPQVGKDDHFLKCGGSSFTATKLVYLLYQEFERDVTIKDIFIYPVLSELAAWIDNYGPSASQPIGHAPKQEDYPLSSSQRRLYLVEQL